jgi:endonuclease/exonuclease/phosphatase (EEP) superfamily protein YafD
VILIAIPAVVLAVASVLAFFGQLSWMLDVVASFRVQLALLLLVLACLLMIGRWRRTAAAAVAGFLLNVAVIAPLFFGGGAALPPEEPLTVLSFNLWASNDHFGEVISYIRRHDPDVVFLHEASRPWEVAMESAGLGYEVTQSRSQELIFGTLVLSRPGDEVTSFGFTTGGARAVEVIHDGVAFLGIHPLAPTTEERAALRDAQIAFAASWAVEQTGPHAVVGDFNATPWSRPFRELLAAADLRNSQKGFGIEASFPTTAFFALRIPIDHLVHSQDLVVADRVLGPPMGSDHHPLLVELWRPS